MTLHQLIDATLCVIIILTLHQNNFIILYYFSAIYISLHYIKVIKLQYVSTTELCYVTSIYYSVTSYKFNDISTVLGQCNDIKSM